MYHFRCNICTFAADIDYVPREYVLDRGRGLHMFQRHVWCAACRHVTPAEALTDTSLGASIRNEQLDSHRRRLEADEFKFPFERELTKKWLRDGVRFAEDLAAWIALRRAPARCLKCGNTDIVLPESDWSDLPHPPCGGQLCCTATIIGGTFARCQPHRYSPEGELLEIGKRYALIGEGEVDLELWGDATSEGSP
jgi:hypothetical protein